MPVGMVLLAPFYHPVLLAEQIGTLAAFARGPLIVTLALGGNVRAFDAFSIPIRQRAGRLEELLTLLRALVAGERVTHHGRYFQLDGVQISPLPRVPVEFWVAGTVPASAERAGRLGDAWLTGQNASREDLLEQLAVYREACERAGRAPRPVLRRDIHVGESDADAHAVVDPILAEGYRGGGAERLLLGGPDTVVRQLEEYRSLGFDEVMVRHVTGDHAQMLASFARIGRDVLPRVRDR
jgi:alkanesulfonate monooxygenase SsuD/methylene tetrahydromethanopterin reductase-like flavin-dependent oxidoreductase (luciferase family)